ncbi:MAG: hypothetical protein GXZ14_01095 [Ruminococcaceae bacterium]|jgi:uncharacterized protein|nr:hypothetical protein [Oscillospiraceae bacterium]
MITVSQIRLPISENSITAVNAALKILKLKQSEIESAGVAKISVDARRGTPTLVYTVSVNLKQKGAEPAYAGFAPSVSFTPPAVFTLERGQNSLAHPPVVCGFGPAGLFCALILARAGLRPIVLERGSSMDERTKAVEHFNKTGELDANTNIQFGEGGAGTFSDGKLTTRISSPHCSFVTDTLLKHGAPPEIAMQQKPHIGTDALRGVITSIRSEIISLGGTVHFNTCLTDIKSKNGAVYAVETSGGEIPCEVLVLAAGHSARDTFYMLKERGLTLTAKGFSVGFRAEHLQSTIDKALYHDAAGHPSLPKGEYQLSQHVGARCVYTFCMCPGGSVVAAASEQNRAVTNGMSLHARDGKNANAAVAVSVTEADFGGDALKAIEFQRDLEEKAFKAGGGAYAAPAQNISSFLKGQATLKITDVQPTYPRGVTACDMNKLFPDELSSALRAGLSSFGTKLRGYTADDAIITGIETRTSSPARLLRTEALESVDVNGIYPCGEGAGYAGGIMSAAADGVRVAQQIAQTFKAF